MYSHMEGYVPRTHELLLMDVKRKHLMEEISTKLGVSYLSDTDKPKLEEVYGIVWGVNKRIFVSLAVEIAKKKKNVIFLVDTGSPHTYISRDVLVAMGYESVSEEVIGNVNGHEHELIISPTIAGKDETDFRDLNILGGNFLTQARAELTVNYIPEKKLVTIRFY